MPRGTTLANVLLMVKGELGYSLTSGVATAGDQTLYTLIDNKQKWLADEFDWPFLHKTSNVSATAATRYLTLPTDVDFERAVTADVVWGNQWHGLDYGIGIKEYNTISSGDGGITAQNLDPILRWQLYSNTQFEVWPIPVTTSTVRFTGQKVLTALKTNDVYVSSNTLDLDDLLIALFVAAEATPSKESSRKQTLAELANARFNMLKAQYPSRYSVTKLVPNSGPQRKVIPTLIIAAP